MKIKFPSKLGGLITLTLAACVSGCDRDEVGKEVPQPTSSKANPAVIESELDAVARAFAKTLGNDVAARNILKAEASKKFDGDFDVLYKDFVNKSPNTGHNVDKQVEMGAGGLNKAKMADVLAHTPYLNVSIPKNIDKWDAANAAPLVTFITADYDKKGNNQPLKAYDKDGQVHWLDARVAPSFPVIVIGASERVTGNPIRDNALVTPKSGLTPSTGTNDLYEQPTDPDGGGGGGGGTYPPPPEPYLNCRNDKQIEYLKSLWMEDVSEYEAWARGDAEVRLQLLVPVGAAGNNGGTVKDETYKVSRGAIENTWYCDIPLFYWDTALTSDAVKYVWVESDEGTTITVKETIEFTYMGVKSTTEVSYTYQDADDMIGTQTMNFKFCPSGGYYQLGGGSRAFRWTIENRP